MGRTLACDLEEKGKRYVRLRCLCYLILAVLSRVRQRQKMTIPWLPYVFDSGTRFSMSVRSKSKFFSFCTLLIAIFVEQSKLARCHLRTYLSFDLGCHWPRSFRKAYTLENEVRWQV